MRRAYAKSYSLLVVLLVLLFSPAVGQAQMSGTPHDLGQHICDYCHLPHVTDAPKPPAWNSAAKADTGFAMYDSPKLTMATEGDPTSVSLVCLSCHDGVTSSNTLLKTRSARYGGHGMFKAHPISITYNRSRSLDFHRGEPTNIKGLPLYEAADSQAYYGQMECASCHNPHDATNGTYLRVKNERSSLCLRCHAI